jgi:hypothetical protein
MLPMYFIGLDVHKQKHTYRLKDGNGKVYAEGILCLLVSPATSTFSAV